MCQMHRGVQRGWGYVVSMGYDPSLKNYWFGLHILPGNFIPDHLSSFPFWMIIGSFGSVPSSGSTSCVYSSFGSSATLIFYSANSFNLFFSFLLCSTQHLRLYPGSETMFPWQHRCVQQPPLRVWRLPGSVITPLRKKSSTTEPGWRWSRG